MLNTALKLNPNLLRQEKDFESIRVGFGDGLLSLGDDRRVVVLSADLSESVQAHKFKEKFPERFFEIGVAEQNMAGVGAGLALAGKRPFITSFGVFSPMRNFDQIRVSICYSNLPVIIVGSHAGFSNARDGATHEALEDIALMRVLPNMKVFSPSDSNQMRAFLSECLDLEGPLYIRSFRDPTPLITTKDTPFEFGKGQSIMIGDDLTLIANGPILAEAISAAVELTQKHNKSIELLNIHTIKPLDTELILKSAKKTGKLVVVEEHQRIGGLGSAIAEFISETYPIPVLRIGVDDIFGESGSYSELLKKHGLDSQAIVEKVLQFLKI